MNYAMSTKRLMESEKEERKEFHRATISMSKKNAINYSHFSFYEKRKNGGGHLAGSNETSSSSWRLSVRFHLSQDNVY
jgi:predicted nucleotidyltransferase